ncbi:uncharacterized protein LOC116023553 [Ipomoea triloba]|uniref:uncharacterized protein LOC116023553 n=1 Tax=Ipomoea triloba TaxID=35885 RepID=UPI00125D3A50|nr:uncharacterized protein LOC116023553 [Ipomoea triloba]
MEMDATLPREPKSEVWDMATYTARVPDRVTTPIHNHRPLLPHKRKQTTASIATPPQPPPLPHPPSTVAATTAVANRSAARTSHDHHCSLRPLPPPQSRRPHLRLHRLHRRLPPPPASLRCKHHHRSHHPLRHHHHHRPPFPPPQQQPPSAISASIAQVQNVDDIVKDLLMQIQNGEAVDPKYIDGLKRRNLIAQQSWKGYSIRKGPKYAPKRIKEATDLTRENLHSIAEDKVIFPAVDTELSFAQEHAEEENEFVGSLNEEDARSFLHNMHMAAPGIRHCVGNTFH